MEEPFVILISSDGAQFELPRQVAYLSSTIRDIFEAKPGKRYVTILLRSRGISEEEEIGWGFDES